MSYKFDYKEVLKYANKPKFKDSEEFGKSVQSFFEYAEKNREKLTIVGLRNHIGVCKETWNKYMNGSHSYLSDEEKNKFKKIARKAKEICEQWTLEKCIEGGKATIGNIFNLKCNHDYIETVQQINVDKTIKITEKNEEEVEFDND